LGGWGGGERRKKKNLTGGMDTGALGGYVLLSVNVINCSSSGQVNAGSHGGGLIGRFENGSSMVDCHSTADVVMSSAPGGGLVGALYNAGVSITNSYATGNVSTTSTWAFWGGWGGLVGSTGGGGVISNSFATGTVSGPGNIGGLVGYHTQGATVTNSYAIGLVDNTGTGDAGGLIGVLDNNPGPTTNSYWNTETSEITTSEGGVGRTTDQMTYPYATNTYETWDFAVIWAEDVDSDINNGYPYFNWMVDTGPVLEAPIATIAIVEGSAEISWDMDFDVTGYKVYAADEPFSNQWDLISTIDDNMVTQYSEATVARKFYKVTSYLNRVESDFSETVGYVGYELEQGLNFVAIPMVDESLSWAQDLADAIGPVDVVNKWNPVGQTWTSAYEFGGIWNDDEEGFVAGAGVYLININQPVENLVFFSVGTIFEPLAQHSLVAGLNSLMLPLDRHDITHAGETTLDGLGLGDEIGYVDVVNKWVSSAQTWTAAYKFGGVWNDDFEISIGDPFLINLTEAVDWPELRGRATTRFQTRN